MHSQLIVFCWYKNITARLLSLEKHLLNECFVLVIKVAATGSLGNSTWRRLLSTKVLIGLIRDIVRVTVPLLLLILMSLLHIGVLHPHVLRALMQLLTLSTIDSFILFCIFVLIINFIQLV